MAKVLNGSQAVPLEEVVLAQALQLEARVNVLERQGVIRKAAVLAEIEAVRAKTPQAREKHHERRGDPRRSSYVPIVNDATADGTATRPLRPAPRIPSRAGGGVRVRRSA